MTSTSTSLNHCTKAVISPATDGNFYYCEVDSVSAAKYIVKVTLPFTIVLNITTYTANSGAYKGNSSVAFSYTIFSKRSRKGESGI